MRRTIKAIPSRYKGVDMRSILETQWATIFDLLGWAWDYEPRDKIFPTSIGNYSPDFKLSIPESVYGPPKDGGSILVEIKPGDSIEGLYSEPELAKVEAASEEFDAHFLIFGPKPERSGHAVTIGLYAGPFSGYNLTDLYLVCTSDAVTFFDVIAPISPCTVGPFLSGYPLSDFLPHGFDTQCYLEWIWAESKNATQWRPSK